MKRFNVAARWASMDPCEQGCKTFERFVVGLNAVYIVALLCVDAANEVRQDIFHVAVHFVAHPRISFAEVKATLLHRRSAGFPG
jgi:hypothetical protein